MTATAIDAFHVLDDEVCTDGRQAERCVYCAGPETD